MDRRTFTLSLGCAIVGLPALARAQGSGRPLVCVLSPQTAEAAAPNFVELRKGLADLGYAEGRSIWFAFRHADGMPTRLPELAADIVALKPDLIIAGSAAGVLAAQAQSRTIPILMFSTLDPVALGVAKSISRPGGNVTGVWTLGGADDALISKRLEILKEFVPTLARLGVVVAAGDPSEDISLKLLTAAAQALGVACHTYNVRNTEELEKAFGLALAEGTQAMFVNQNSFFFSRRLEIASLAAAARLPAIYGFREHAEAGGLVAYGASLPSAYRQSARLVDKILKGANPGDLPIEQPTTFELVINLKAAKALGIAVSPTLLARADAVIE